MQIGRIARETSLSLDAIRFYERSGLLPRPLADEAYKYRYVIMPMRI